MMRLVRVLPWMVAAATTAFVLATIVALKADDRTIDQVVTLQVPALLFAYVGAVIMTKRPDNRMGWLFSAVGWFVASGSFADEYANIKLAEQVTPSADVILSTWYSEWFWIPFVFIAFGLSIMLFPTGRPLSPRWRPFLFLLAIDIVILTVAAALDPLIEPSGGHSIHNPIGISPLGDPDEMPLGLPLVLGIWSVAIGGLVSVFLRFRRSRGEERQQLKWFLFSAVVTVVGFLLLGVLDASTEGRAAILDAIVFSAVPVGAGIAILKYRLYDVDVFVNRSIVYLALSVSLGLVYFGGVALLQGVIGLERQGDLAVATSTLLVAGLFQPVRRRIQDFIDHYFYRRRYDAQRTVDAFTSTLRDEIDLEALNSVLISVVAETMQPTHVSVWLPKRERAS
jgi:hypothetical protein